MDDLVLVVSEAVIPNCSDRRNCESVFCWHLFQLIVRYRVVLAHVVINWNIVAIIFLPANKMHNWQFFKFSISNTKRTIQFNKSYQFFLQIIFITIRKWCFTFYKKYRTTSYRLKYSTIYDRRFIHLQTWKMYDANFMTSFLVFK